jgi:hypothetical protein
MYKVESLQKKQENFGITNISTNFHLREFQCKIMLRKTTKFIIFVTFEASGFPIPAETVKSGCPQPVMVRA